MNVVENSIKCTFFVTPFGQFEYKRIPFGLKTVPSKFQRFMNKVLDPLIRCDVVAYLDDFLIATHTLEHYLRVLRRIFKLLAENKPNRELDVIRKEAQAL